VIPADDQVDEIADELRRHGTPAPMRLYRFVRHENVDAYERLGWLNTGPLPGPHGFWSACLEWLCDCPAPTPDRRAP
jgi:hypothetical protein